MPRRRSGRRGRRPRPQTQAINHTLKNIELNTRVARPINAPNAPDKIPLVLSTRRCITIKRKVVGTTISVSGSASTFGAQAFYVGSFDTTSEIVDTYSFYRIIELTVDFQPIGNFVNVIDESNDATQNMGHFHTVIDVSAYGAVVPVSMAELEQYKTCQTVRTGQYVSRTWTPHTAVLCYNTGGLTNGYGLGPSGMWISSENASVEYYGIRWGASQTTGVANGSAIYSLQISAVIQCWAAQ